MNVNFLKDMISESSRFDKEKKYWLNKFSGELTKSCVPYDFIRNNESGFSRDTVAFEVPGELFAKLNHLSNRSDNNLFVVLAAGLTILLSKYTGNEDIVAGMPILRQEIEGEFLNVILALRNRVPPAMKLKELLMQLKQTVNEANDHSNYPVERLQYYLGLDNVDNGSSLFETVILLQNIHEGKYIERMNHNMVILFDRSERSIAGRLEYNSRLYRRGTAEHVVLHLLNVLQNMVCDLNAPISGIDILPGKEREVLLTALNDTHAVYPADKLFHELFEDRVKMNPGNKAVVSADDGSGERNSITYTRLNERANRLARCLVEKGVGPDTIVGIMVEPSPDLVVAVIAVLKAGGAFLPLDPESPGHRARYLLMESHCGIMLTQPPFIEKINFHGEKIDIKNENLYTGSHANLEGKGSPQQLFYTIYTSGTTGRPKGGLLTHRNLVNYVTWFSGTARLTGKDRTILTSSYAFDLGYTIFLGSLLTGGELHFLRKEMYMNAGKFLDYIKDNRISYLKMTPSLFTLIANSGFVSMETCSTLRLVVLGGEEINTRDVETVHNICRHIRFMNHYGPTEATIGSVARFIDFHCFEEYKTNPTIGKPVHNTHVYILDKHLALTAAGIPGELFIGGDGVGRGYMNMPETSSRKFIPHPSIKGERIYRTGDLARWMPDENIQFLGRKDNQVKIRGYRVELGEIENQISKSEKVKDVAVIAKEDKGTGRYLCAYIVPSSGDDSFNAAELKEFLSGNLPDFMMPSYLVPLDKIPLTPNGKLDRKALPLPEFEQVEQYIAPRDETETALVDIWAESLNIKKELISVDSNFFNLGGHSLSAAVLVSKIHQVLHAKVPIVKVFEKPTLENLAEYIAGMSKEAVVSITPGEKKEYYPPSSAQTRLYILQQMELDSTVYHINFIVELEGILVKEKLQEIFGKLAARHESLRTSFEMVGEDMVQRVHDTVEFEVNYHGQPDEDGGGPGDIIDSFIHPFHLSRAPLLRVEVVKTGKDRHLLMTDMHHIITDGISQRLLIKDFLALYGGRSLPSLRVQYKDYAEWQQRPALEKSLKKQEDFWLKECGGQIPVLDLPTDYVRPVVQSFEGAAVEFTLNTAQVTALTKLGELGGATVFMVLMTLYNIFLSKITGQDDIIVGIETAGRTHPHLEPLIGMFVNSLPLRNFPAPDKTFNRFLQEVKERSLKALDNQGYQFENLVEKVSVNRDTSRNPIFDAFFSFMDRGPHGSPEEFGDTGDAPLQIRPYSYESKTAKFDLTLNARQAGEKLFFSFEYCIKLFNKKTIDRFIRYFKQTVARVIAGPNREIAAVEIISDQEKQQVLYEFNNTWKTVTRDRDYSQLFEQQACKNPCKTAVVFKELHLTYGELSEQSDGLAYLLKERGVTAANSTRVALYLNRSPAMLISIIGTFKAGSAYIPLEVDYPPNRIKDILEDGKPGVVIAGSALAETIDPLINAEVKQIIAAGGNSRTFSHSHGRGVSETDADPDALSYLIYTSGSTGKPKGVMIHRLGMINHLYAKINHLGIGAGDIIAQTASACFDISVWQFLAGLLVGGTTFIVEKEIVLEPRRFLQTLRRGRITILESVPSLIAAFLEYTGQVSDPSLRYLRWMIPTGEPLTPLLVRQWLRCYPHIALVNAYGPTEASDDVTHYVVRDTPEETQMTIPIGKPLQNLHVYVLDKNLSLCPTGIRGEICVAGIGVGKGYWQDDEKSRKAFIPNPFIDDIGDSDYAVLYKTGDIGYYREDGILECLGRLDDQLKIRGNRIELGEIEKRLNLYEGIKEAVVAVRSDNSGNKYLCAYIVSGDTAPGVEKTGEATLREYLSGLLPEYMIPSFFLFIDKIPLTPNGKVDRHALPEVKIHSEKEYVAPMNEIEKKLIKIWEDILPGDYDDSNAYYSTRIGIDDNFFRLGGHSLKATQMITRIHKELNYRLSLTGLFKNPTVRGLARHMNLKESFGTENKYTQIPAVEKKEFYALSSAQKRLYVIQQMDVKSTAYNICRVVTLQGEPDIFKLEETFRKLIRRHENLRTSFEIIGNKTVQRIHKDIEFALEYKPKEGLPSLEVEPLARDFVRPFDLSEAPLMRVALIEKAENAHLLMVDMHHIITDGISHTLLMKDFMSLYADVNLPPLRVQYKDYCQRQIGKIYTRAVEKQAEYWLEEFSGKIPRLDLPLDYSRHLSLSVEADTVDFELSAHMTRAVKSLALEEDATLFIVLLAVFYVLLAKLSDQEDIVVGTLAPGRMHTDLQEVIGVFLNNIALRNFPRRDMAFNEFLRNVKKKTLAAFDNQDYHFEELVARVVSKREPGRNPLFDVMFGMVDLDIPEVNIPGLTLQSHKLKQTIAKFDLMLLGREVDDTQRISFNVEYKKRLFKQETIESFITYFKGITEIVAGNPGVKIGDIQILNEEEEMETIPEMSEDMAMQRIEFEI